MSKARKRQPRDRSLLYRLIAAGQLVHHALLEPALLRGLEPGDDALLYLLATSDNVTAAELADGTGLAAEPLRLRIARLIEREFVVLRASGPQMLPRLKLDTQAARGSKPYWLTIGTSSRTRCWMN